METGPLGVDFRGILRSDNAVTSAVIISVFPGMKIARVLS